jgi:hypothetical protein
MNLNIKRSRLKCKEEFRKEKKGREELALVILVAEKETNGRDAEASAVFYDVNYRRRDCADLPFVPIEGSSSKTGSWSDRDHAKQAVGVVIWPGREE